MAKRLTVYRIENSKRKGPYYYSDCSWQTRSHGLSSTSCPWNDGIESWSSRHVCGFISIQSLKKWFSSKKERKNLHKAGYFIAVYRSLESHVIRGIKQIVFVRNKRRMKKMSLVRIR